MIGTGVSLVGRIYATGPSLSGKNLGEDRARLSQGSGPKAQVASRPVLTRWWLTAAYNRDERYWMAGLGSPAIGVGLIWKSLSRFSFGIEMNQIVGGNEEPVSGRLDTGNILPLAFFCAIVVRPDNRKHRIAGFEG